MYKNICLPTCLIIIITLSITSCQKEDYDHAPSISLIGYDEVKHPIGESYVDEGATATDKEDGGLSSEIIVTGTVADTVAGEYILTYEVEDSYGNNAITSRSVYVTYSGNYIAGNFEADEYNNTYSTDSDYDVGISENPLDYFTFYVFNIWELGTNYSVEVTIDEIDELIIPYQTIDIGSMLVVFQGSGKITNDGETIILNYSVTYNGSVESLSTILTKIN